MQKMKGFICILKGLVFRHAYNHQMRLSVVLESWTMDHVRFVCRELISVCLMVDVDCDEDVCCVWG